MAELLIVVVVVGVVLLYAGDRVRKLRTRARQMAGINERLDVAAAKVDEQQERKQARVRASAELTSVMPAIKRPPLTLPGVPGLVAEPGEETEPEAAADTPEAESSPPAADAGESVAAQAAPEGAPGMPGGLISGAPPAPTRRVTFEGTLIMPAVPVQGHGPGPDRGTRAAPAASRAQGASGQERAGRD